MVLLSIALTRPSDVDWFTRGVARFLPEAWARFRDGASAEDRDGDLAAAYDRLINHHPDPAVRLRAVRDWVAWEDALVSNEGSRAAWDDPAYTIAFARLVTHYFSHAAWLDPGELLANARRLAGIPGVILHGRLDLQGPPGAAWDLAQAWPGAALHPVPGGHTGDAEMEQRMLAALERFAGAAGGDGEGALEPGRGRES
jgi:proline iminopeptidase